MGRKKQLKKKKKAIQEIDRQILDTMGDMLKEAAKEPNEDDNPFTAAGKILGLAFKVKSLSNQRKMIVSQPIRPKNYSKGCFIVGEANTERIINAVGKDVLLEAGFRQYRNKCYGCVKPNKD